MTTPSHGTPGPSAAPPCPQCGEPMRRRGYFGPNAIWACTDCGGVFKRPEPAPAPGFVAIGPPAPDEPGPLPIVGELRPCQCGDRLIAVRVPEPP